MIGRMRGMRSAPARFGLLAAVKGRVVSVVRGVEAGASLEFLFESRDEKDDIALLVAQL